jgi:hypothetical protein
MLILVLEINYDNALQNSGVKFNTDDNSNGSSLELLITGLTSKKHTNDV